MKTAVVTAFLLAAVAGSAPAVHAADPPLAYKLAQRLNDSREAYQQVMSAPDSSVPQALLEKCKCIAVIPGVIKGAIGYGARFGQGVVSCRNDAGEWSPPAFLRLTGGSVGFQIGAEKSDIVLFFMTEKSARSLLDSKFTLGGKASVAAGPVGRGGEASTDLNLNAEIYTYGSSKGLFAGISLEGARLSVDDKAIAAFYGKPVPAKTLLFEHQSPNLSDEAEEFLKALPASK